MMDLAMMGSGTGAVQGSDTSQIPAIRNRIKLKDVIRRWNLSRKSPDYTYVDILGNTVVIDCGDSRMGWVEAYEAFMEPGSR